MFSGGKSRVYCAFGAAVMGVRFGGLLLINILLHKFLVGPFLSQQARRGADISSAPYAIGVVGFFTAIAEIWFVFCAAAGIE